jgi:hypothetical protein
MNRHLKSILCGAMLVGTAAVGLPPSAASAACGSPDQVYASNVSGVTVSGTVTWPADVRKVNFSRIVATDRRDGRAGRLYVQFMQTGQSYWKDRTSYSIPDGGSISFTNGVFARAYSIQKVDIGVGALGDYNFQIAWDANDRCDA